MEIDNLWFIDFKYVPMTDISLLTYKYNQEILAIQYNFFNNSENLLIKYLTKILKHDFSTFQTQKFPKSYFIKGKYSFQANKINFVVIIYENSLNQLDFKLYIKKSTYETCLDPHADLIMYFRKGVLDLMLSALSGIKNQD